MYSSLLTGYGRAADKGMGSKESFFRVDAVFNDMKAAGVKPDVAVYNAYIMAACRCEKWTAAVQVSWAFMRPCVTLSRFAASPPRFDSRVVC
jgi:pentatricopeptide repeat protein